MYPLGRSLQLPQTLTFRIPVVEERGREGRRREGRGGGGGRRRGHQDGRPARRRGGVDELRPVRSLRGRAAAGAGVTDVQK